MYLKAKNSNFFPYTYMYVFIIFLKTNSDAKIYNCFGYLQLCLFFLRKRESS